MTRPTTALVIALTLASPLCARASEPPPPPRVAPTCTSGPLTCAVSREAARLAQVEPPARRKKRISHPVWLGAAIGASAGFVVHATQCRTGEGLCTGAGNALMAGIGAGVGAAIAILVAR